MNYEHCQEAEATPPQQAEMLLRVLRALSSLLSLHDWQRGRPQQVIFTPISTRQS